METIIVFFESPDRKDWKPVERDNIPDALRNETVIDRMLGGEDVHYIRHSESGEKKADSWWTALRVGEPKRRILPASAGVPPRLRIPGT